MDEKRISPSSPFYPEYAEALAALGRAMNNACWFDAAGLPKDSVELTTEILMAKAWVDEIWQFIGTPMFLAAEEAVRGHTEDY